MKMIFNFTILATILFSPAWSSVILGNLTGSIADGETGKPIQSATITVSGVGSTYTASTDEAGYFSFVDLEPGTYVLKIERVGYKSLTVTDIPVSANSTYFQSYRLTPAIYNVKGITVTGYRNETVNPLQTMTYYGFTGKELTELFPGPASLSTVGLLEELPGVESYSAPAGFALGLSGGPHVRGGTGLGTVYALDGIPLNNNTFYNDLGNVGLTTGLTDYQFYPGIYPVQYGNGIDGYQNTMVPEGFGPLHGSFQFSYGFWLDPGETSPVFAANPLTGAIGSVIGTSTIRPSNPDYSDLQLDGQVGKFHYFLNYIAEDGGESGFENPSAAAALAYSGVGGTVYDNTRRDGILNLNYDFDPNNELEALLGDGYEEASSEFEFPIAGGTEATFEPVPPFIFQHYDLESLEYTHRFSPGKAMTFRVWQYNNEPDEFTPSPADGYFSQDNGAKETGGRLEFKLQLTPQHLVTAGGQYLYTAAIGHAYPTPADPAYPYIEETQQASASTQNPSAWLNDEWTPVPNLDVNVGLRWDHQNYLLLTGNGILTQPNGLPFAVGSYTGFSPDDQINNPADSAGLFTNCLPGTNVCANQGVFHPSFVQPRISASYQVTDKFTVKSGFGEFSTFPQSENILSTSTLCAANTGAPFGIPCTPVGNVAYTTGGNLPETGDDYDLSFEYLLNDNSFVKVTPYYKTVNNPLVYTYIPVAETGGEGNATSLNSKGVEVTLHTEDWHGLTGTLNYTYTDARIIGDPSYSFFLAPTFVLSNPINGALLVEPNMLPNAAALFSQANSQSTPADWDIPNDVNLQLDYKPDKQWEIAPNFTFASGQPYGLGASQLESLYVNLESLCTSGKVSPAACAMDLPAGASYNPLGETSPNSLASPSVFLANLAVTYHVSPAVSTTLSIFNLFNNNQVLSYNSTATFPTYLSALGYPNLPDYSPLRGKYSPFVVQGIRQYFVTTTFKF